MAQPKSWQQSLQELWQLLTDYAKQETVGPLKNLGARVGKGLLGSLLVSVGYLLIVLGVMRFLQRHYDKTMHHSYIAYGVAALMIGIMMGVAYKRMTKSELPTRTSGTSTSDGSKEVEES